MEDAISLLLVINVAANVLLAVGPDELTLPIHLVVLPLAVVGAAITPPVDALTHDVVVLEVAFIHVAIAPGELAVALLDSRLVIALKLGLVWPSLHTSSILSIVGPKAPIERPILMEVVAKAVSLVILPLPLVDIAIFVQQTTRSIGLIVLPVPFIEGAIGPHLDAAPLSDVLSD